LDGIQWILDGSDVELWGRVVEGYTCTTKVRRVKSIVSDSIENVAKKHERRAAL